MTWLKQLSGPRIVQFALLLLALGVLNPIFSASCGSIMVKDPATGISRPATQPEIAAILQPVNDALATTAVISGQPQYVPLVQLLIQGLALLLAWKTKTAAEPPAAAQPKRGAK
jgi:hypothetical protein